MSATGKERRGSWRRRWGIAVGCLVLTAVAARLWLFEKPVDNLSVEVPADASFQYQRFSDTERAWQSAPEVSPEVGRAILELVNGSEACDTESLWIVRLDWPPVWKLNLPESLANATLDALSPDSNEIIMRIEFHDESRVFGPTNGRYIVPEGNISELERILDALDAQCRTAHEQQQAETRQSIDILDHGELPDNPDGEQLN